MPRWEVCRIAEITVGESERGGGLFSRPDKSRRVAWVAEAYTPSGETRSVAQTDGWDCAGYWDSGGNLRYAPDDSEPRQRQHRSLIAQLGFEGWEPMPLVTVGGSYGDTSYIHWYFKRPLPEA